MAHQAHNIPWYALASHLEIHSPEIPTKENPINLYFQLNPNQENDIRHFATSFAKNIREHTACERKKYPEKYDIPGEDDILLEDAITQKISPVVYKWRQDQEWELPILVKTESSMSLSVRKLCTHDDGFKCGCAIPYGERKLSSFLRQYRDNSCYKFFTDNAEGFYNIELVKTLILYGEMDPILRVCSHPDVDYKEWQSKAPCYDTNPDAGWDMIYESALCAYLCLNILYCFPEFWDPKTQNKPADYRSTKLYQRTLRTCNWSGNTSEVPYYPHRAFFGVDDNQFRFYPHITSEFGRKYMPDIYSSSKWFFNDRDFPYGRAPFDDFLRSETHEVGYLPDVAAVALVRNALYSKGLPEELVSDIMEKAEYTVKRRLVYPDDPFHPGNWDELQKYLKYCWRLMVNCNMMADALGASIEWEGLIYTFLSNYMSSPGGRKIGSFRLCYSMLFGGT